MPAGGRGYTRPPSLISLWSTAPFLLNNTVGTFDPSPRSRRGCAPSRTRIEQMLWPEKRDKDPVLGDKIPGHHRPDHGAQLRDDPDGLLSRTSCAAAAGRCTLLPRLVDEAGDIELGPIPAGVPVGLISNLNLRPDNGPARPASSMTASCSVLLVRRSATCARSRRTPATRTRASFANLVEPLLELSKCPDLVVNRGHYFGTDRFAEEPGLSDAEARPDRVPQDFLGRGTAAMTGQSQRRRLRLRGRRLGRRRRHGGGAAGRSRACACSCSRPAAIRELHGGVAAADATACPTTTTCRPSTRFASENEAMRWDFFVRHYADDATAAARSQIPSSDGRPATACSIRAPARSAAAPRTTR